MVSGCLSISPPWDAGEWCRGVSPWTGALAAAWVSLTSGLSIATRIHKRSMNAMLPMLLVEAQPRVSRLGLRFVSRARGRLRKIRFRFPCSQSGYSTPCSAPCPKPSGSIIGVCHCGTGHLNSKCKPGFATPEPRIRNDPKAEYTETLNLEHGLLILFGRPSAPRRWLFYDGKAVWSDQCSFQLLVVSSSA